MKASQRPSGDGTISTAFSTRATSRRSVPSSRTETSVPSSAKVIRSPSAVKVKTLSDGADTTARAGPPSLGTHSTKPRLSVFRFRVAAGSSRT